MALVILNKESIDESKRQLAEHMTRMDNELKDYLSGKMSTLSDESIFCLTWLLNCANACGVQLSQQDLNFNGFMLNGIRKQGKDDVSSAADILCPIYDNFRVDPEKAGKFIRFYLGFNEFNFGFHFLANKFLFDFLVSDLNNEQCRAVIHGCYNDSSNKYRESDAKDFIEGIMLLLSENIASEANIDFLGSRINTVNVVAMAKAMVVFAQCGIHDALKYLPAFIVENLYGLGGKPSVCTLSREDVEFLRDNDFLENQYATKYFYFKALLLRFKALGCLDQLFERIHIGELWVACQFLESLNKSPLVFSNDEVALSLSRCTQLDQYVQALNLLNKNDIEVTTAVIEVLSRHLSPFYFVGRLLNVVGEKKQTVILAVFQALREAAAETEAKISESDEDFIVSRHMVLGDNTQSEDFYNFVRDNCNSLEDVKSYFDDMQVDEITRAAVLDSTNILKIKRVFFLSQYSNELRGVPVFDSDFNYIERHLPSYTNFIEWLRTSHINLVTLFENIQQRGITISLASIIYQQEELRSIEGINLIEFLLVWLSVDLTGFFKRSLVQCHVEMRDVIVSYLITNFPVATKELLDLVYWLAQVNLLDRDHPENVWLIKSLLDCLPVAMRPSLQEALKACPVEIRGEVVACLIKNLSLITKESLYLVSFLVEVNLLNMKNLESILKIMAEDKQPNIIIFLLYKLRENMKADQRALNIFIQHYTAHCRDDNFYRNLEGVVDILTWLQKSKVDCLRYLNYLFSISPEQRANIANNFYYFEREQLLDDFIVTHPDFKKAKELIRFFSPGYNVFKKILCSKQYPEGFLTTTFSYKSRVILGCELKMTGEEIVNICKQSPLYGKSLEEVNSFFGVDRSDEDSDPELSPESGRSHEKGFRI